MLRKFLFIVVVLMNFPALAAIITNTDLINAYDGNFLVKSTRVLSIGGPIDQEFAAQVVAIEMLRTLMASGLTVEQYNATSQAEYDAFCLSSELRGTLNINAPVAALDEFQINAACNIGGNYFEHGYQFIMDGIQEADKITFTRIGGL